MCQDKLISNLSVSMCVSSPQEVFVTEFFQHHLHSPFSCPDLTLSPSVHIYGECHLTHCWVKWSLYAPLQMS